MSKVNYQLKLERLITDIDASGARPKLLMHVCCAPCSSYCLEYLKEHFDITLYYYNPNIDTEAEYLKRFDELKRFLGESGYASPDALAEGPYEPDKFKEIARGHEADPERGERCLRCYTLRLAGTERYFRECGCFDYFCTTLSLSPHKDADSLNAIGIGMSDSYLPTDFKKRGGYLRSIELSREYGLYRQDYCGCVYSKKQRQKEKGAWT